MSKEKVFNFKSFYETIGVLQEKTMNEKKDLEVVTKV